MATNVVETRDLTKKYGDFTAVDRLDLTIKEGEVFGLLGPNGAGKTTTLLMLLGLTEPTSGWVRVLGEDPARRPLEVKARVGYLPETLGFYTELTAWENLIYSAKLNGLPRKEAYRRVEAALDRVGLASVANQRVATFSHGMRQRLGVADVLLKKPSLIIMDEPTQGLDPERTLEFLEMIRSLQQEGITILLSSHQLHQVQAVCNRVGLFHAGQMVLEGTVKELAQRVLGGAYRIHIQADGEPAKLKDVFARLPGAINVRHADTNRYEIEAEEDLRSLAAEAALRAGSKLLGLMIDTPDLEKVYTQFFEEVEHANRQ